MEFVMEHFRDVLFFLSGFMTTFTIGYMLYKDSLDE